MKICRKPNGSNNESHGTRDTIPLAEITVDHVRKREESVRACLDPESCRQDPEIPAIPSNTYEYEYSLVLQATQRVFVNRHVPMANLLNIYIYRERREREREEEGSADN